MKMRTLVCLLIFISTTIFAQNNSTENLNEVNNNKLKGYSFYSNIQTPDIALFDEYNFTSFELLAANIELQRQQVIVNPYKMFCGNYNDYLSETRVNISQKDKITTFGLALGINSGAYGSSFFSAYQDIRKLDSEFPGGGIDPKTNLPTDISNKDMEEHERRFRDILVNASSFALTIGTNIQLFEIIGGDKIDKDNDGKIDNEYSVKGYNFTTSFLYKFNSLLTTSFGYNYIEKRSSPVQGNNLQPYFGLSAGVSYLSIKLNREKYRESEEFKKYLFISCIIFGVSLEYAKYNGPSGLSEDGIKEQLAVSPFIEFRINRSNIFSIAIPIKKISLEENKSQTTLGGFLQYSIALKTSKD
jgi:hypothetical protein